MLSRAFTPVDRGAVLDTCSVRALGAPYLLLPRLSRVLDNLIPCYKYIPSYRRVLMSDIRLLRAGVCVSPLDRLVRRAVGPPLPQAISISLSVFLPMADDEPPRSPRLAAAMDSLAVSFLPGFADRGELSVCDSFSDDFGDMFYPVKQVPALVQQCRVMATKPAMSAAAVETASLRAAESREVTLFVPPKVKHKPYDVGASVSSASSQSDERSSVAALAKDIIAFMTPVVREAFLPGKECLPDRSRHDALVLEAVKNSAGRDHLRACRDGLRRLDAWLSRKFSSHHGFEAKPAVMAWFLQENKVLDDADGHAPQSLVAGLRFASDTLKFPFSVSSKSLRALSKAPTKSPKQAPSASLRMVYHFFLIACCAGHSMPLRGVAAVFMVMSLCALRGVDAQRSRYVQQCGTGGHRFFIASAYNSKSRTAMDWACPICTFFKSDSWFAPLRFVWGSRDFMFAAVRFGVALADASELLDRQASPYLMLRYLREILMLADICMALEEARRLRRHSFRHFLANVIRIRKFPMCDAFQGGRWKEQGCMPLRYAQEVQMVTAVDLILRVISECEAAMKRQDIGDWPLFGGWENFLQQRLGEVLAEAVCVVEPAASEAGSDGDSSDDELEIDASKIFKARSSIRPASRSRLPEGWRREEQVLSSGTVVPHFYGPSGEYARSCVGAWRVFSDASGTAPALQASASSSFSVGQRVQVWWTEDAVYYCGSVSDFEAPYVSVQYDDGDSEVHDVSETLVETEGSCLPCPPSAVPVPGQVVASPQTPPQPVLSWTVVSTVVPTVPPVVSSLPVPPQPVATALVSSSSGVPSAASAVSVSSPSGVSFAISPPKPKRPRGRGRAAAVFAVFGDDQCGNPLCRVPSVNGGHAGICLFDPPASRNRRPSDGKGVL